MQIWQYNIYYINIIAMKNVIIVAEKNRKNRRLLAMENKNKSAIAKVAKISNIIYFDNKYSWAISNANINIAGNLKLTSIQKY